MAGIKIKTIKAQKLAYLEHTGDYGSIPYDKYFDQLYAWVKEKKIRPGFKPLGIFHDDPDQTPPEKCRSEICIPIVGDAEPEGDIKIKDLPSMDVAVIKHKGTSKEYQNTYKTLGDWITQNGYEWAGPSMEIYTKKPKAKGDEVMIYATVQVPVKKKGFLLRKVADQNETESEE
ncbi:MAG: GyrI-like domain-containing protein [Methanomassiliicoccales archaeon]|nr:MAG: GyrI-like domain-containing protein [Methanomassiliicoccales archaeon]